MPLSHRSPKLCPQTDINEKSLMVVVVVAAAAAALNFQTLLRQENMIFPFILWSVESSVFLVV